MNVEALARQELLSRSAYVSAVPNRDLLRLHANESPWSIADLDADTRSTEHDLNGGSKLNIYPEPRPVDLVAAMSHYYGVDPDCVLPVRGSDDGIDLLIRAFCQAGRDSITVCSPTFSMYASFAGVQDAKVVEVATKADNGFSPDVNELVKVAPASKLVFICTPNNPTGQSVARQEITGLCEALIDKSIVVVDEAYIEFSAEKSVSSLLSDYPNLVILRTLSKAFGAAGIRCGAVLADSRIIRLLSSIATPYALPTPTIEHALKGLSEQGLIAMRRRTTLLAKNCQQLSRELDAHPVVLHVYPSDSNFILVKFSDGTKICKALQEAGVLVRDFSRVPGIEQCLRISTGRVEENKLVLDVLNQFS